MRERAWHRVRALSVCLPPHRHASRQLSNEDSATTVRQRLMTGEVARTLGAALPVPRVSAVVHPLAGGWILAMIFFATFAPDRYAAAMQEDRAVEWWTMLLFAGAGVARLWFAVRYRRRRRRTSALRTIGGGCAGAGHRERRVTEAAGRRHGAQARLDGIDRRLPRHGPVGAVPGRPLPGGRCSRRRRAAAVHRGSLGNRILDQDGDRGERRPTGDDLLLRSQPAARWRLPCARGGTTG